VHPAQQTSLRADSSPDTPTRPAEPPFRARVSYALARSASLAPAQVPCSRSCSPTHPPGADTDISRVSRAALGLRAARSAGPRRCGCRCLPACSLRPCASYSRADRSSRTLGRRGEADSGSHAIVFTDGSPSCGLPVCSPFVHDPTQSRYRSRPGSLTCRPRRARARLGSRHPSRTGRPTLPRPSTSRPRKSSSTGPTRRPSSRPSRPRRP
jgi:hypothetical protein